MTDDAASPTPDHELGDLWGKGQTPDVAAFLRKWPMASLASRVDALRVDQANRWARGEQVRTEEYFSQFLEVAADPESALLLVFGEMLLDPRGVTGSLEEAQSRFPHLADLLALQVQMHDELTKAGEMMSDCPDGPADTALPAVPGYAVLGVLGEGGMGTVYRARYLALGREVALKMLRGGAGQGEQVVRLRREAEALSRLRHPHIVQVYEVGESEGRSYFAMELVEGGGLDRRLNKAPVDPRDAAALVEALARAVHAAHEAGVLHRDLKPANVLMGADGLPRVADFGLAKRLDGDGAGHTQTGEILGTPSYMAPEQARGLKEIGPAVDVYALGAVLYECLTGRPPFLAATAYDTLLQVVEKEPVALRQLNVQVPRDLETVCLKCLEKDPERRYVSCMALAEDLGRWLGGRPVVVRPVGPLMRAVKWARRNPAVAALTVGVVLSLGMGAAVSTGLAIQAAEEARRADERADEAEQAGDAARLAEQRAAALAKVAQREAKAAYEQAYRANSVTHSLLLDQAARALADNLDGPRTTELLQRCPKGFDATWEDRHVRNLTSRLAPLVLTGHQAGVSTAVFSPGGDRILSSSYNGILRIWDACTGQTLQTLKGHAGGVCCGCFSPDGKLIVSGGQDKSVQVWDAITGRTKHTFQGHTNNVSSVCVSPDGRQIASAGWDATVRLWDVETGRERHLLKGHTDHVQRVVFSPNGEYLATSSNDKTVRLWATATGQEVRTFRGHTAFVTCVCFSPDGKQILSASWDTTLKVWETATGKELLVLRGHSYFVESASFSPDGKFILSGGRDRTLKVWDAVTGQEQRTLKGHSGWVLSVGISPDGLRAVSGSLDGTLRVWDLGSRQEKLTLRGHPRPVLSTCISPDGRFVVSGSHDGTLKVWTSDTGREKLTIRAHSWRLGRVQCVSFSPDGKHFLSGSWDTTVKVWEAATGKELRALRGHTGSVLCACYSPDGKLILSGSGDNFSGRPDRTLRVWDAATGMERLRIQHAVAVESVCFSKDSRRMLAGCRDGVLKVYDTATGREIFTLRGHKGSVFSACYSDDGKLILSGSVDGTMKLWDAQTGLPALTLQGHTEGVMCARFSPNSTRILSASQDQTLKLWDPVTGQEKLTLRGHAGPVMSACFSPDGTRIVSGSWDRTLKIWDAPEAKAP